MRLRKWISWKLHQIAYRIYNAEWLEAISIQPPNGKPMRIEVIGDEYGCGISYTSGIHWHVGDTEETAEVDGWKLTWHEPVRLEP